jgi:hypothetical protein
VPLIYQQPTTALTIVTNQPPINKNKNMNKNNKNKQQQATARLEVCDIARLSEESLCVGDGVSN